MKRLILPVWLAIAFVLPACQPKSKPVQQQQEQKQELMPGIAVADSAAIMYYQEPGNPRFFTMLKLHDKAVFSALSKEVNGPVIPAKDSCVTQGKIYFYGKHDAVEVIYFSTTRECMTLSFIKTGEKYFTKMTEDTKKLLDEGKKNAKEVTVPN